MDQDRMSGVLLHVTSLPSDGGIGGFRPGSVPVRRLSGGGKAASVAGAAAEPDRVWRLALLGSFPRSPGILC